ncbi:hypothetical protein A3G56_02130 [Candidatus Falkowbacteria bacterium RIFCSPLOWO2_12_FULL_45_10]|uniref:SMP-30/Gluconolactonase/LRE-like region domain-containing protein n=2 Tax=Candidatus Falkowiibacteriota TaxID=1752728 RepID=A0A1F5RKA1_9BACT|nr:MAG: hypothetical protein A3D54_01415 [Candidatus Falkowbacteria bacterium RIFCSPHIGHO2_02_FULL_45_15]OGF18861.1 MAG: hypothetical protein A3G56_02130 [Candidatus Falkowbacteria bacterium RIFCSPLOWO2_12_FULL_45_10]
MRTKRQEQDVEEAIWRAKAESYQNQESEVTIPKSKLDEIVTIPLGFQPAGISSRQLSDNVDQIAIADYFAPAVCLAKVTRDKTGLHFTVEWIRGVDYKGKRVRMFPDILYPGMANRMQTVSIGPDGKLWITRNEGREFFVLQPPAKKGQGWTLKKIISLPECKEGLGPLFIQSAFFSSFSGDLIVIESNYVSYSCAYWYEVEGGAIIRLKREETLPIFMYGISHPIRDAFFSETFYYFITDYRCEARHGIYRIDQMDAPIVPRICGTGIAFLFEGGALVTRYGQAYPGPFNGKPGALIYVPPRYFGVE